MKYISILKGHSLCTQQFLLLKFSIMKEMEKREKYVDKNVYCSIYSSKNIIQISKSFHIMKFYISFKMMA